MIGIYKDSFLEFLKEKLSFAKLDGSKNEIISRCPWCESTELTKKKKRGHLYISLKDPIFHCFRCNKTGVITKLVKYINGNILDIVEDINVVNNIKKPKDVSIYDNDKIRSLNVEVVDEESYIKYPNKVNYINQRFGKAINISLIPKLVFNIRSFIENNNIELNNYDKSKLDDYEKNFIGFLSYYESILLLRNCDINGNIRYRKILLNDSSRKLLWKDFYGFSGKTTSSHEDNVIFLSEGPFDILVPIIYKPLVLKDKNIIFYASVMSNKYEETIFSLLNECKLTKCNVVIFSDTDVKNYKFKSINESPYVANLEVYKNSLSKDFGVPIMNPVKVNIFKNDYKKFNRSNFYHASKYA